jgi:hypothetical protein
MAFSEDSPDIPIEPIFPDEPVEMGHEEDAPTEASSSARAGLGLRRQADGLGRHSERELPRRGQGIVEGRQGAHS